jgi:hypothetical protein
MLVGGVLVVRYGRRLITGSSDRKFVFGKPRRESIMKFRTLRIVFAGVMLLCFHTAVSAPGWNRSVAVTSLGEDDVGGEVVQFTVSEVVDNSAHCPNLTGYAIRDSATLRGGLALLTSAMLTGRQVDIFVTGTCDATGMPNVIGIILR